MPTVEVISKDGGRSYPLEEGKPMFIGRAKECDIFLPSSAVSRRHAVILYKNGICGIKDLGSFNGTLLNNTPIGKPRHITENDTVKISSFVIRFHPGDTGAGGKDGAGPDATDPLLPPSDTRPARPQGLRPDSSHYSNTIRLPRAMHPEDAADAGYEINPADDTVAYNPGTETTVFLKSAERAPAGRAGASVTDIITPPAGKGSETETRKTGAILPGPDETAYFLEPPLPPEAAPDSGAPDAAHGGGGGAEDMEAGPESVNTEAEAVIPLLESDDVKLVLTLEEDKAANDAQGSGDTVIRERVVPVDGKDARPSSENDAQPAPLEEPEPISLADTGEFPAASGTRTTSGADTRRYDRVVMSPDTAYRPGVDSLTTDIESLHRDPVVEGLRNIDISPELMAAINARLSMHAMLMDLAEERKLLRQAGGLSAEVAEELNRQDLELEDLPTGQEAARLSAEARARREQGAAEELPDTRSDAARAAEELARSQWKIIRDSNMGALPAVYKEAYPLAGDEPLARELARAKIAHGRLMGGAAYLLALERLAFSASKDTTRIRRLAEEDQGAAGMLSKVANTIRNRTEVREKTEQRERETRSHAYRAELARRETRFITKMMNIEFRSVYTAAALHFIPRAGEMPPAVRAFLRYGAIGFKPWWMTEELRNYILDDCLNNVAAGMDQSRDGLSILHADEYLEAVAEMECAPLPDENLAALEKSTLPAKTDRAYRRIVNARTYNDLMQKMLADLDIRGQLLDSESAALEVRIAAARSKNTSVSGKRENLAELQSEHQTITIRKSNLDNQIKRIEKEVVSSIIDSVQEAEGRFRKGELAMPAQDFLIEREVGAIFQQCRRMGDKRGRFMPMTLRTGFPFARAGVVNTRRDIRAKLEKFEQLDPGLFATAVIPAKKRVNRVELRISPVVVILPAAGEHGLCPAGREGMGGGHLMLPACFLREDVQERQLRRLLADFRWETSRGMIARDLINSDTLAGSFMRVRWEWRNCTKEKREKGLIFNEMNDQANWRRVYEVYLPDAVTGGKQLFLRNPDCYYAIIGKYIDLPDGVPLLRRSPASPL